MKYRIEKDNLQGTKNQGYAEVVETRAVVDFGACRDNSEKIELLLHEVIEAINLGSIPQEHALQHDTVDTLSSELAKIAEVLGWKVPEIPEEGITIE